MADESFELIDDWELALYAVILEQLERQKNAVLDASFFAPGFDELNYQQMSAALAPILAEVMVGGIDFATPDSLVGNVAHLFENQRFYAEQQAAKLIKNIDPYTKELVNQIIQDSIIEGWDIKRITQELIGFDGSPFSEFRARRIAVTETTNAFMGGSQLALDDLKSQGLNVQLRWWTAHDDRVCAICAPRHGKVQGDGWTIADSAHVGCRCGTTIEEILI